MLPVEVFFTADIKIEQQKTGKTQFR